MPSSRARTRISSTARRRRLGLQANWWRFEVVVRAQRFSNENIKGDVPRLRRRTRDKSGAAEESAVEVSTRGDHKFSHLINAGTT
eukprot:11854708-Heterocapsa_arctica.AAC.1